MASFRYVAINPAGEMTRGAMDAASAQAVIEAIRKQGNIPVRADPAAAGGTFLGLLNASLGGGTKLRRQEVANITRELAIMLGAGQDLDRALRFLVETAPNPRVAGILDQMRAGVRDGASLATVLGRFPASFSRLYVGLVRAGEAGGALAATLDRLATLLERERSLQATVTSALVYPALLMVASIGAIVLLLTQVLPQFVPLFEQNGAQLPTPTRLLIGFGNAVSAYGLYALLALIVLVLFARQALRQPPIKLRTDRLLLRLPVFGKLTREVLAARFTRTLGTLVINGLPLIAALDIVRDVIGNLAAVAAVQEATESAKGGAGLARPLGTSGIFPLRTTYLLRLGEETAQLGPMALRAAEIHEENTRLGVQRLVALLVPVIIIVMGAAVAGIVASLLLAMLSLNDLAG
jgi:general secretion pathway protein F